MLHHKRFMKEATIKTIQRLSKTLRYIKNNLFYKLEEALNPLTEKQRRFIEILEVVRIEDFIKVKHKRVGSKKKDRKIVARAFLLKLPIAVLAFNLLYYKDSLT